MVITCTGEPASLAEIERVLAITKDVVLRALLHPAQPGRGRARPRQRGARCRSTTHPEGEAGPSAAAAAAGGRGGGSRRPR